VAFAQNKSPERLRQEEQQRREDLNKVEADLAAQRLQRQELAARIAQQVQEREEIQAKLVIAGRAARENEIALSSLEDVADRLAADASAKRKALTEKQKDTNALSAALQRLSAQPGPTETVSLLGLGPQGPIETARAAMLLGSALPHLDRQAQRLRGELTELNRVEREVRQQRERVRAAAAKLIAEQRDLDRLIERKQALERQLARESGQTEARVASLSTSARDIRELLDSVVEQRRQAEIRRRAEEEKRLQEEERREAALRTARPPQPRPPPEIEVAIRPDAGARGLRTMPVTGKLVWGFGQQTETAGPAKGMTIQCRALALVVAPDAGRVLFAGPFRGYGQILIIEHSGGYHSLLSGLGRIDSAVGSSVRAGEPVGLAGSGQSARAGEEGGRDQGSTLYFELRRNGQPTNPAGWLSAERTR
jgi:septal ring factor EnvC (AmiA/AmiB activator)